MVVKFTRPEGSTICVATSMLDPLTANVPPRSAAVVTAAGCTGASSATAPVADKARSRFDPAVMRDALTVRSPTVLIPPLADALSSPAASSASDPKPLAAIAPPPSVISGARIVSVPAPVPAPLTELALGVRAA